VLTPNPFIYLRVKFSEIVMSEERKFRVEVAEEKDFAFRVDFGLDGVDDLIMDEPEPMGGGAGPNASRVLAAAIGNCLCASFLFCLRKSRAEVSGMRATVEGAWVRNEEGRWRIREMEWMSRSLPRSPRATRRSWRGVPRSSSSSASSPRA